ncbi:MULTISPECIES: TSUP family transporter [Rahnella]|uniref:TSUP family transporter n=1 Tax=Rahnella TaxID=34037 RepID=UPI003BA16DE2
MEISLQLILLFFLVAIVAGCVDAIAGGGGLITIPVMLAAGINPAIAIATNKLGGVAGTFASTLHFIQIGEIDLRKATATVPMTFIGALLGGLALTKVNSAFLSYLIPLLLLGFSLYFIFSPEIGKIDKKEKLSTIVFAATFAPSIGFYDGFFGPGSGTFFCLGFTLLLGYNLIKATAYAKLLNFASNLAALLFFIIKGDILWKVGAAMLIGQFIGGHIGARLVVKSGRRLIKALMVIVAFALSMKMLL